MEAVFCLFVCLFLEMLGMWFKLFQLFHVLISHTPCKFNILIIGNDRKQTH